HTNRPLTDFGGKTSIFSHSVYLFLREFSLQDSRGGSVFSTFLLLWLQFIHHGVIEGCREGEEEHLITYKQIH
ncbi:hypothetical protein, partial [Escherichia coli]